MRSMKLLVSGLAIAAVGGGVCACAPPATSAAGGSTAGAPAAAPMAAGPGSGLGSGSPMTSGVSTGPGSYLLAAMPAGTVSVERGAHGHLRAVVNVFGLTPGSSHAVFIGGPLGHPVRFPALTANAVGQADATLTSVDSATRVPPLARFVILLGDAGGSPLAAEPIAETGPLPARPAPGAVLALHAVTFGTDGAALGQPAGRTTISYNAAAQTLTVTLTASRLNPGPHAAHIHLGSCRSQGPVKYMLADFVADASGDIVNQTRVVAGVTSVPGPGNWYLNLHQGGMSQILANGTPTLSFRPMLCTDITSFATAASTPGVPPSGTPGVPPSGTPGVPPSGTPGVPPSGTPGVPPSGTPSMTMPAAPPTMTMPAATPTAVTTPTPTATPSPTGIPTAQPTHW
jgi:hypothetical protein